MASFWAPVKWRRSFGIGNCSIGHASYLTPTATFSNSDWGNTGAPAEAGFSLLKALKRSGAMTAEFTAKIIALAKGARTVERTKELAECTMDVLKLYHRVPAGTIGPVMREIETTEELEKITRVAETAPREVALVSELDGKEGLQELKSADASEEGLTSYLRVGKKSIVRVLMPTHVAIGILKNARLEKLGYFLHNVLSENARNWVGWTSGLLAALALLNAARHIKAIRFAKRVAPVQVASLREA